MKFLIRTPHYIDDKYYDTKDGSVTYVIDETILKGRPPSMQMEPQDAEAEKAWKDYHDKRPQPLQDIGETARGQIGGPRPNKDMPPSDEGGPDFTMTPGKGVQPAPREPPKRPADGVPITGHSKTKV